MPISKSSNARALPAEKRIGPCSSGFVLGWLLPLLVLALGACCPGEVEANVRPLLPLGVEPPLEEQADLELREKAWGYLDAAGVALEDPDAPGVVAVMIPFQDYLLLLGVLDGWREAARAYRDAALFRDPRRTPVVDEHPPR